MTDTTGSEARIMVTPALTPEAYNVRFFASDEPTRWIEAAVPLDEACDAAVTEGQRCSVPVFLNGELYKEPAE